jgi:hypothetical protein
VREWFYLGYECRFPLRVLNGKEIPLFAWSGFRLLESRAGVPVLEKYLQ